MILRSNATFTIADQAVVSVTSLFVVAAVARQTSPHDFGVFATLLIVAGLFSTLLRSAFNEPYAMSSKADSHKESQSAVLTLTLLGAPLASAVGCLIATRADSPRSAVLFGVVACGISAAQDAVRGLLAVSRSSRIALPIDAACLMLWILAVASGVVDGLTNAFVCWGSINLLALVAYALALRLQPSLTMAREWFNRVRGQSARLTLESVIGVGSIQGLILAIGWSTSLTTVGGIRGAQTLFGPFNVLLSALNTTATADAVIAARRGAQAVRRVCAIVSAVLCLGAIIVISAIWWLPDSIGSEVLGETWPTAHSYVPALSLMYFALALGTGSIAGLRAAKGATASLQIQILFAAVSVPLTLAGLLVSAHTAVWLMGASLLAVSMFSWLLFTTVLRRRAQATAGDVHSASAKGLGWSRPVYSSEAVLPDEHREDVLRLGANLPGYDDRRFEKYYSHNPLGPPVLVLARDSESNVAIGMGALFPTRVVVNGEPVLAGISGDFAIDPAHRGLGPALQLARSLVVAAPTAGFEFVYGTPNEASQAIIRRVGYHDLGRLSQYVKLLRSAVAVRRYTKRPRLARLVGHVADPLLALASSERRYRLPEGLEIVKPIAFDERFASLIRTRTGNGSVTGERSADLLNWKFGLSVATASTTSFSLIAVSRDDEIVAYAAYSTRNDIRHVADIAYSDDETLSALLAELVRDARRARESGLSMRYFGPESALTMQLRTFGFIERPDALRLMVYVDDSSPLAESLIDPANWTFMAADMDF